MKVISETVFVIKILEVVKWNRNFKENKKQEVFRKQKRKAKVPNFQENSLVFQLRAAGKYGASWKVEWGFYRTFNGSAEGGRKK